MELLVDNVDEDNSNVEFSSVNKTMMTVSRYKSGNFDNDKPGSNNVGKLCALHTTYKDKVTW